MKKIYLILVMLIAGASTAWAEAVTISKAAELACHRIERLVTLKKIDESYLTNFGTMAVTAQKQNQPTDPAFKVMVSLYPGADSKSAQLEILMDNQGKTLSFNVVQGPASINAPKWQDKDAVTLVENSLHYVLEGWQILNPAVKPFYTDLKSLRLSQVTDASGQLVSKVEFLSNSVATTLEVYLKMDGNFISAQIK